MGFGGKAKAGESIEQANLREMMEETGVLVNDARKIGLVLFTFECEPDFYLEVHLFQSNSSFDNIKLNDEFEGEPVWYSAENIPYSVRLALPRRSVFCPIPA